LEKPQEALKHCIEINRYENDSDRPLPARSSPSSSMKRKIPSRSSSGKEIFEVIETAVDKCEDVANVIGSVILKSA